jgi:hypothetical protein
MAPPQRFPCCQAVFDPPTPESVRDRHEPEQAHPCRSAGLERVTMAAVRAVRLSVSGPAGPSCFLRRVKKKMFEFPVIHANGGDPSQDTSICGTSFDFERSPRSCLEAGRFAPGPQCERENVLPVGGTIQIDVSLGFIDTNAAVVTPQPETTVASAPRRALEDSPANGTSATDSQLMSGS